MSHTRREGARTNAGRRPGAHSYELVATCAGGLEPILERELAGLGISVTGRGSGLVRAVGTAETVVTLNRRVRTASRILISLVRGQVETYDDVYALARKVPWESRIYSTASFAVTALARSRTLTNHKFLAMRVKDAVADRQRDTSGRRSNVDRRRPDYPIVVHVDDEGAEISLDTSGRSLHERGYRREAGEAPLRESLAAGLVLRAGWDGTRPLLDPFCGSGTIVIEAALMQAGRGPGDLGRRYAFEGWPEFRGVSQSSAGVAAPVEESARAPIIAADKDAEVVEKARRNARRAGVEERITFVHAPFEELEPDELIEPDDEFLRPSGQETPAVAGGHRGGASASSESAPTGPAGGADGGPTGVIICNPPYGERMVYEAVAVMYQMIGDNLKARYPGWEAWIFTANLQAAKRIGLRSSSKTILYNGGLESRLYEFRVY
jgi:23S rRNA G2445 N2-methylase RlmL